MCSQLATVSPREVEMPECDDARRATDRLCAEYGELPGLSVFLRDGDDVFHTYSTYQRGLDIFLGTYNYLDVTPLGRQEENEPRIMAWLRHHDRYATAPDVLIHNIGA